MAKQLYIKNLNNFKMVPIIKRKYNNSPLRSVKSNVPQTKTAQTHPNLYAIKVIVSTKGSFQY